MIPLHIFLDYPFALPREAWESLHSAVSKPAIGRIAVKVINHLGDEVISGDQTGRRRGNPSVMAALIPEFLPLLPFWRRGLGRGGRSLGPISAVTDRLRDVFKTPLTDSPTSHSLCRMKVKIWLQDGSILQDATLASADIKIDGLAFDIKMLAKMDDAFLYTSNGSQIYRKRVSGTIGLVSPGVSGPLNLSIDQIRELRPLT